MYKNNVFISYSGKDEIKLHKLLIALSESEYTCIENSSISDGLGFDNRSNIQTAKEISESQLIIIVLSENSNDKKVIPEIISDAITFSEGRILLISLDNNCERNVIYPLVSEEKIISYSNGFEEIINYINSELRGKSNSITYPDIVPIVRADWLTSVNLLEKYILVSGLSGYGKTTYSNFLASEFEKNNYLVHRETITEDDLDLNGSFSRVFGEDDAVSNLINEILFKITAEDRKGLIFILDLDEVSSHFVPIALLQEFTLKIIRNSKLQERIKNNYKLYTTTSSLSGSAISSWPYPYGNHIVLRDMSFEETCEIVKKNIYLQQYTYEKLQRVSVRFSMLSGGHPNILSKLIKSYKKNNEVKFTNKEMLTILSEEIIGFSVSLDTKVIGFVSNSNLFFYRFLTQDLLLKINGLDDGRVNQIVASQSMLSNLINNKVLEKVSVKNFGSNAGLMRGVLVRRVYLVYQCLEDSNKYIDSCEQSENMYFQFLKHCDDSDARMRWLIEYWYSYLLRKILLLFYSEIKIKHLYSESKFENLVANGLKIYFREVGAEEDIRLRKQLEETLVEDLDFCCLLSYIPNLDCSKDCYQGSAILKLVDKIRKIS